MNRVKKGMWKRATAFLLSALLSAGASGEYFMQQAYAKSDKEQVQLKAMQADVYRSAHWAQSYLDNLYNKGLMRGNLSDSLDPDSLISRAEFLSIMNKAFGYYQTGKNPFKDIKGDEWYADDVLIAFNKGYFTGDGKNTANATGTLTREQAVTLLCRALKIEEVAGENLNFTDGRTFAQWSRGYLNAADKKGYLSGYEDGSMRPTRTLTKGEAAKIFSDTIGRLINTQTVEQFGYVDGNVTISTNGATLQDTTITGDLYITDSVGLGYTNLNNVKVLGEVIISGAGESNSGDSSIVAYNCFLNNLIVNGTDGELLNLKIDGNTTVTNTTVKSNTYLVDKTYGGQGFKNIDFKGDPDEQLDLNGNFSKVTVFGKRNSVRLNKGTVQELVMDEEALDSTAFVDEGAYVANLYVDTPTKITGEGDIGNIIINTGGTTVASLPDQITIRAGSTATVDGVKMTSKDAEESSSNPRILGKYPSIDDEGSNNVNAYYKTNKQGTIYWAITLEEDGAMSADELVHRSKNNDQSIKRGSMNVKTSNKEEAFYITGLKNGTSYILSMVLEDSRGDVSARKKVSFETTDTTKPTFTAGYPKVKGATNTYVDMIGIPTKDCTLYWAVYTLGKVAPTVDELKNETTKGHLNTGKIKKIEKNEETMFQVSGLQEAVTYDLFVVLSDGERESQMYSMKITTKDMTPPKWVTSYPQQSVIKPTSVEVKYNIDETSTVYYALVNRGAPFPKPVEGQAKPPELQSNETKQNIITGNNTLKSGKAAAKPNTEGKLNIAGLKQETPYDVYFLAQDAAGNLSDVKFITIKTTDTIAPTATLAFSEYEDTGNNTQTPLSDANTIITFSEEVWSALTNKTLIATALSENIILYDLTTPRKTEVPLDFTLPGVTIVLEENQTIVTIPPTITNYKSGNTYQYALNNIVDTSGNKMKKGTELPPFTTVAPYVTLTRLINSQFDMVFEMEPQITNTSDEYLFDILFTADTDIDFNLYQKEVFVDGTETDFRLIAGKSERAATSSEYIPYIEKDKGITLYYIKDRKVAGLNDYVFELFNQIKANAVQKRVYAIELVGINKKFSRAEWDATVNIGIKCIIGSKTGLSAVANSATKNPKEALENQLKNGVLIVNTPQEFSMEVTFADTVAPRFLPDYPRFYVTPPEPGMEPDLTQVGDTYVNPILATTKACRLYYVVGPKKSFPSAPTDYDIMNGNVIGDGILNGQMDMGTTVNDSLIIRGLTQLTEYRIFFVLKGVPPETTNTYLDFKTNPLTPPKLDLDMIFNRGSVVSVDAVVDMSAVVDWALVEGGAFADNGEGERLEDSVIIDIIRSKDADAGKNYNILKFGTENIVVRPLQASNKSTITYDQLESNKVYYLYAVAKSVAGSDDSLLAELKIVSNDDVAPQVKPGSEHVQIVDAWLPTNPNMQNVVYNGNYEVTFTEPLYFMMPELTPTNEIFPLTPKEMSRLVADGGLTIFRNGLSNGDFEIAGANVRSNKIKGLSLKTDATGGLTTLSFSFRSVMDGTSLTFTGRVCDKSKNVAGNLQIVFSGQTRSEVGEGTPDPRMAGWKATFLPTE